MKSAILVCLSLLWFLPVVASPILSEIMATNTKTLADGEGLFSDWIEIHNPDAAPLNLSGFWLTDDLANPKKWAFPSTTLGADARLIVFASGKGLPDAKGQLHANFRLEDGGEYLALVGPDGSVVSEFTPTYPRQWPDVSYGRARDQFVYFTTPTPGVAKGDGLLRPSIFINEINYDPPDGKEKYLEFVELCNPLANAVDISGWALNKGVEFRFPAGTSIPAGGYLVIGESPEHLNTHLKYPGALGPWTGGLSNESDTVELLDATGALVDRVDYQLGFPWPTVGDLPGNSINLLHEGLDSSLGGSWRSAAPSPGAPFLLASLVVPPQIRQVEHSPKAPKSGEVVLVTAHVTDPDGVASVDLQYQLVEPGAYLRKADPAFATSWTTLAMRDDGAGGDVARDHVYTARLPAETQVHRRLVRYRIEAKDKRGTAITVPYADDPATNFAYFVYDGVPAWKAAVQPGTTPAEEFSEATMRKVRAWHFLSHPADVQACQYNSSTANGRYRWEGCLVIEDKVYDHVLYRAKGQNSTFNTGKNKWKFKFLRGHWLSFPDDYGREIPVQVLNLSSVPAPWAPWNRGMHGLDEAVAFKLSNLAGAPAPYSSYVHWRVIDGAVEQSPTDQFDGDFWGLYLAFENQDGNLKDSHGLPDGNTFRMQATGTGNELLSQGKGMPSNLSDLRAFISTSTGYNKGRITDLSTIQPVSWWRQNVHLEEYYNWRAVTEAINQTDRRDQENVAYFRRPDGRWEIWPWDVDLLYEQYDRWGPQASQSVVAYEQIQRCLLIPEILLEWQNRARELQDLLLNEDQAWKVIDEFISIITDEKPRLIPNGEAIADGFVEAERRRWDYWPKNPVPPRGAGKFGNYYKNPYPIGNQGLGPKQPFSRKLATADFEGMVKWVKDFIAFDNYGGARLRKFVEGSIDPNTLKPATPSPLPPERPSATYDGPANFPIDQLRFHGSPYKTSTSEVFLASQWRVGEVRDPSTPNFVAGQPWIYEAQDVWRSPEMNSAETSVTIPVQAMKVGRTYRVRVRHKDGSKRWSSWSAPVQFTTSAPALGDLAKSLVISEIMYAPKEGRALEYVEVANTSATATLDLSGVRFTNGIDFAFPEGKKLAPGARLLVVADTAAFAAKYGDGPNMAGQFVGSLDNAGERLTLSYGAGLTLREVRYDSGGAWPAAEGQSLALIGARANPPHDSPASWRAGPASPGTGDGLGFSGEPARDADGDGVSALMEYVRGTSDENRADSPAPLQVSRDLSGDVSIRYSRNPLADDAALLLESSPDLKTWSPAKARLDRREVAGKSEILVWDLTASPAPSFVRLRAGQF